MDFVVGRIPRTSTASEQKAKETLGIEAKILHVREPRRRRREESSEREERRSSPKTDPPGARVLVILVPDAYRLPEDLDDGDFRVFLRFVRK